ncbi:hypothetical protein RO3G_15803 [Rhizopus delemar RA 99-880]|uniref:Uncharacterized protein n=1 Tax=Rhizopus delemar (strain RA 99-880 / ATCC MYA-4621 / FGSC 9543 / NRRL 43880) TaxID=246409 RepID=I1CRL2_RHIO9|nr:hypothetical protein RO3G_15803 [Rhizopus delemar RA 99-880]|eukprot:EIE91092.1 hypothetical protein RO3G_15803 [Rhizopus delemar RA 99-880]
MYLYSQWKQDDEDHVSRIFGFDSRLIFARSYFATGQSEGIKCLVDRYADTQRLHAKRSEEY